MLILTRRLSETLVFRLVPGEVIRIPVTGLNGNQVCIGTQAPREIHVRRGELPLKEST